MVNTDSQAPKLIFQHFIDTLPNFTLFSVRLYQGQLNSEKYSYELSC